MQNKMQYKELDNGNILMTVFCPVCGKRKEIRHEFTQYEFYKLVRYLNLREGYIQDELSFLDADAREQILSGTCPDCFKIMSDYMKEVESEGKEE